MKRPLSALSITLALTLGLILAVLWLSGALTQPALAQSGTGVIRVSATDPNSTDDPGCGSEAAPCLTIQQAVSEALPGYEIHVAAGTYDNINSYGGHDQVVAISDTLTLRGGYTTTAGGWDQADPDANPTIVDANGQGRVMYVSGDVTVTVEGLHFINGDATGEGSHMGSDLGGGIFVISATTILSDCAIHDNVAARGSIGFGGGLFLARSSATLLGTRVYSNTASTAAEGHGGGLYLELVAGAVNLSGNQIYSNTASTADSGEGGGLWLIMDSVTLTLTGNDVYSNTASIANSGEGGGLWLTMVTATVTLTGNHIYSNTASTASSGEGGGLWVRVNTTTVTLTGNQIYSNTASTGGSGEGGGLWLRMYTTTASLTGNQFYANTGSTAGVSKGGGLWLRGGTATLTGNQVYSNTASLTNPGLGGGLAAGEDVTLALTSNDFLDNVASTGSEGIGGGIYLDTSPATLVDNTIRGNSGSTASRHDGKGGGLLWDGAPITLTGNTVQSNTASLDGVGEGGGLYCGNSQARLNDNTIQGNTASRADYGYGGGLYLITCDTSSLTGNHIESNTGSTASKGYGGGFYVENTFRITASGNFIEDNTACTYDPGIGRGGAVYVLNCSNVLFSDNNIAGNVASRHYDGYGGGLWVQDSATELYGNNLLRNTATLSGTSEGLGGALYAAGRTRVDMINNMVAQNRASSQGSGLWFGGQNRRIAADLLHNTIADNGAPRTRVPLDAAAYQAAAVQADAGHGIFVAPHTSLEMTNTILSGHPGAAIYVTVQSTATLEASLWFNNGANTDGYGTISTGTINVTEDPTYVDPASGDYHLTLGSAAIDAGIDAGVNDDFDAEPRPARNGYDLGADEFPYDLQLVPDRSSMALPGDLVVYSHTLTNTGLITTAFAISHASDKGWALSYRTPITVAAGDSATLYVTITVPATAVSDTVDATIITASVASAPSAFDAATDTTTVLRVAGVQLSPGRAETVPPGTAIAYAHTLTNAGNSTDTFGLSLTSSRGWSTIDGTPLTLGPRQTTTLLVQTMVPVDVAPGLVDTATLTAASTWAPSVTASATDTTTAGQHHVYLPIVLKGD